MSDITKCEGGECPIKETCYRFTAEHDELHQSYFITPPYAVDGCMEYWEIKRMTDG